MLRLRSTFAILATGVLVTMPALAQQQPCKQKEAIYSDEDGAYSLTFKQPTGGLGISSNYFEMLPKDGAVALNGWVIWSQDVPLPEATLGHKCPEGDITGAELEKCSVWKGVVYQLLDDAQADVLGPGEEPAAKALLLPGFGLALRSSGAWEKDGFDKVPWDVFRMSGCTSSQ